MSKSVGYKQWLQLAHQQAEAEITMLPPALRNWIIDVAYVAENERVGSRNLHKAHAALTDPQQYANYLVRAIRDFYIDAARTGTNIYSSGNLAALMLLYFNGVDTNPLVKEYGNGNP